MHPLHKWLSPTNPIQLCLQCWLLFWDQSDFKSMGSAHACNYWRDGTYGKVKSQLLQTLMSSQRSFKQLQLKVILCYFTLKYERIRCSNWPKHTLQSTQFMKWNRTGIEIPSVSMTWGNLKLYITTVYWLLISVIKLIIVSYVDHWVLGLSLEYCEVLVLEC